MGKKKQPFMYFMFDKQNEDKKKGINKPIEYYQDTCGNLWRDMDENARRKYKDMAGRQAAFPSHSSTQGSASSSSAARFANVQQAPKLTPSEKRMQIVRDMFDGGSPDDDMKEFPIFLTAGNIFCKANVLIDEKNPRAGFHDVYYPMEIGIARYTLKDGIDDATDEFGAKISNPANNENGVPGRFHRFIDPGEIAKGYASDGKEHCEKTHLLELWPCVSGSVGSGPGRAAAFAQMARELFTFAKDGAWEIEEKEKYIFYTLPAMVDQMIGIFEFIARASNDSVIQDIVTNKLFIGDAADLLMNLMKVSGNPIPKHTCTDRMTSASYSFTDGKDCDFHREKDNQYCALGAAVKMAWYISDNCLGPFGIDGIPGKHLPIIEINSITETVDNWNDNRNSTFGTNHRNRNQRFSSAASVTSAVTSVEYNRAVLRPAAAGDGIGARGGRPTDMEVTDLPTDPRIGRSGIGRGMRPAENRRE